MTTTAPVGEAPAVPRRWAALVFIALAQLMVVLDATVVNIALPSAQKALGISTADRQWVITAYTLVFGGLLLFGGRIADLAGRKRTFLVGLLGFAGASALGGAATSEEMLFGARALQGAFGALLAPSALSLLSVSFTQPRERAKAFGIYGAIAGGGAAVGLMLGGVLTEYLDWRWVLYVNVPIAVVAFAGALTLVHVPAPRSGERRRLDVPGAVLVTGGLVALVYVFTRAESEGWRERGVLGLFAAAAVLITLFVVVEAVSRAPLLPLRVVTDRRRGGAYIAVGLAVIAMFGLFLFLTYYLQVVKGYSPIRTGLAFLPFTAGMIIGSTQIAARLMYRVPARALMVPGLILAAAGMWLLTHMLVDSSYTHLVLPSEVVISLGLGTTMMPAMNLATTGVAPHDSGVASAMVNTAQQVGGSIGTALLNTIAATATTRYIAARAHGRPSPALAAAGQVHGYATAIWWSVGIMLLTALLVALIVKGRPQAAVPGGAPAAERAPVSGPDRHADGALVLASVGGTGLSGGPERPEADAVPAVARSRHRRAAEAFAAEPAVPQSLVSESLVSGSLTPRGQARPGEPPYGGTETAAPRAPTEPRYGTWTAGPAGPSIGGSPYASGRHEVGRHDGGPYESGRHGAGPYEGNGGHGEPGGPRPGGGAAGAGPVPGPGGAGQAQGSPDAGPLYEGAASAGAGPGEPGQAGPGSPGGSPVYESAASGVPGQVRPGSPGVGAEHPGTKPGGSPYSGRPGFGGRTAGTPTAEGSRYPADPYGAAEPHDAGGPHAAGAYAGGAHETGGPHGGSQEAGGPHTGGYHDEGRAHGAGGGMGAGGYAGRHFAEPPGELFTPRAARAAAGPGAVSAGAGARGGETPGGVAMGAAGSEIRGSVHGAGGVPLPGAMLTLVDLGGRQLGRAVSGDDGAYALPAPGPGAYVLIATGAGHRPRAVTVVVGDEPLLHRLTLDGTAGLTGVVRAERDGAPIAGAIVVLADTRGEIVASGETDERGMFAFQDLLSGTFTLAASAAGNRPAAITVQIDDDVTTRCEVRLAAGMTLRGTVRAGADGRPLGDARVTLVDAAGGVVAATITGADGEYAFHNLDAGSYTVIASGYPPVAGALTLQGSDRTDVDIALGHPDGGYARPGASLAGAGGVAGDMAGDPESSAPDGPAFGGLGDTAGGPGVAVDGPGGPVAHGAPGDASATAGTPADQPDAAAGEAARPGEDAAR